MNEVPESWASFKAALIKEFRPTHALKIARDSLATLQQTSTVEEYVDNFQNLALEIPDMSAAEALDRFERGLRPEAFEHVRDMAPQNLASAFRIALDFESRRKATQAIVGVPTPTTQFPTAGPSMGGDHMDLDAVQFRPNRHQGRQDTMRCFFCEGKGHKQFECPSKNRRSHTSQQPGLKDEARR
jgi:hypothetical protein